MDEDLEGLWEEPQRAAEMAGAFEDKWKVEGRRAIGLAEGMAEGIADGQRKVILQEIVQRLGVSVAKAVGPRIETIRSIGALDEI